MRNAYVPRRTGIPEERCCLGIESAQQRHRLLKLSPFQRIDLRDRGDSAHQAAIARMPQLAADIDNIHTGLINSIYQLPDLFFFGNTFDQGNVDMVWLLLRGISAKREKQSAHSKGAQGVCLQVHLSPDATGVAIGAGKEKTYGKARLDFCRVQKEGEMFRRR